MLPVAAPAIAKREPRDLLSKSGAEASARRIRKRYRDNPAVRVWVEPFRYADGKELYAVRSNIAAVMALTGAS